MPTLTTLAIPPLFVLTPLAGASFPALAPLILAAAGALGYKVLSAKGVQGGALNKKLRQQLREDVVVPLKTEDLIFNVFEDELRRAETIHLQRGVVELALIKDERGRVHLVARAKKGTDRDIVEREGREFAEELAQLYARNRVVEQLGQLNAEPVEETVDDNGEIVLKIRRWK